MTTLWIAVVVRIAANPLSNVAQKLLVGRGVEPAGVIFGAHLLLAAAGLAILPRTDRPGAEFWLPIVLSAMLAVAANTLITAAMHLSDLSVLGPINAYKSIVSLLPGFVLLGEVPSLGGLAGMGAIVAGSYLLVDRTAARRRAGGPAGPGGLARLFADRGVRLRTAALVLSAVEAVFLKRALSAATPAATFAWWAVLGLVGAAAVRAWQRGMAVDVRAVGRNAGLFTALALTTGMMQYTTLVTLDGLEVGYSLALFQTSAVLSVLLGRMIFREAGFWRRLAGSIVMAAGAALIVLARTPT